ncbi:hypothetical protein RP20_CCG022895, partial [Aedes albopictus]
ATALECYECSDVDSCLGQGHNFVARCTDAHSQAMYERLSSLFYPNLQEAVLRNGKYQCASFRFTRQGENEPSVRIKGCMFETTESLCRLEASPANFGVLNCQSCNTHRCNRGSATLGWSLLIVVASLVASFSVAK